MCRANFRCSSGAIRFPAQLYLDKLLGREQSLKHEDISYTSLEIPLRGKEASRYVATLVQKPVRGGGMGEQVGFSLERKDKRWPRLEPSAASNRWRGNKNWRLCRGLTSGTSHRTNRRDY